MVFFLVLATNLIDRNNFSRIKDSVTTIYEDRLVAKDFLYKLTVIISEKEKSALKGKSNIDQIEYENIDFLITEFANTKLGKRETEELQDLIDNIERLRKVEAKENVTYKQLESEYTRVQDNLERLAGIQILEGKRQVEYTNDVMDSIELFTKIEIYVLIILALLMQFVVLYTPKSQRLEEKE
jgi:flagellar motility protein MotE (MotC chaperone)